jgi:hypothetical protein
MLFKTHLGLFITRPAVHCGLKYQHWPVYGKLYKSVIRPIVTYASETWVLKESSIQKLMVFERKILRKLFGPTRENQLWRIKTNDELDKLIKHQNIINHIKAL